jgi:CRP-like cAMP-binding protein
MARLPLVSPLDRALFLKAQPYLEGLPPHALAVLAQYTEERSIGRGQVIHEAGDAPDRIHFLASGRVRTQYRGAEPFDVPAPGGIGLVEYLAESEEPPRVWAVEETFALSLGAAELSQLIEEDFVFYEVLAGGLSRVGLHERSVRGSERSAEPGFADPADALTPRASLDLVHRIALARRAPFFSGSDVTVMTQLLRYQEPRSVRAGDLLWGRDDPVESLALVLSGRIAVCNGDDPPSLQPAGAMLGTWEVFGAEERLEDVRALEDSWVLEIDRTLFTDLLEDHAGYAMDFLGKLAHRLIELRYGSTRAASDSGAAPGPASDSGASSTKASGSTGSGKSENGNGSRDSL